MSHEIANSRNFRHNFPRLCCQKRQEEYLVELLLARYCRNSCRNIVIQTKYNERLMIMARTSKVQSSYDVDHAYWRLDHDVWGNDIRQWKMDVEAMEAAVSQMQERLRQHRERIRNHEEVIRKDEIGIKEHEEAA